MKNTKPSFLPTFIRIINGVALVFVLRCLPAAAEKVTPMPDSWDRIIGYLDFAQPDMTEDEVLLNAPNYSFVFGGLRRLNDVFRATNPDINIGRYTVGFFDEYNARPEPRRDGEEEDTPERRARTLLWWNTEVDGVGHPDWVLYRCDGVTPAYWFYDDGGFISNMPLDFSNPAVSDWQLRNADELGFSAYFADLVYLENYSHACGIWRGGQWVQLFSGQAADPAFSAAVIDWAARIQLGLHSEFPAREFVPNCPLYPPYQEDAISALLDHVDGLLDEEGFTWYNLVDLIDVAPEIWVNKIRNMIAIQERGVAYYSMNYVSTFPPSQEEVEWVLGSFLMGKEHSAYILMTLDPPLGDFGPHWPHLPQYDEDIGHPCAPMASTQNVYVRDYSKGLAVVNPGWERHTFYLPPGDFRDIFGNPVSSPLLMEAATGKVLLASEDRCP